MEMKGKCLGETQHVLGREGGACFQIFGMDEMGI